MSIRKYLFLTMLGMSATAVAQDFEYRVETQLSVSDSKTPLWLNANKYGLSSLEGTNGYVRAAVVKPYKWTPDSLRLRQEGQPAPTPELHKWDWTAGLDLAVAKNHVSGFVVQQAYVEGRWWHGTLTLGAKEYQAELKNNRLSSGSQTLGINARPVPQARIALPEYWTIPALGRLFHIKGHIAFGAFTDGNWQEDFSLGKSIRAEKALYHSKAGYLKIGKENKPFSAELGLEMAAQFGGECYKANQDEPFRKNGRGLKNFWTIFWAGGGDPGEGEFANAEGNQMGSWVLRFNYDQPTWRASIYADHYFDDHSQMFFLDYDGYGEGERWNERERSDYYLYKFKDIMLGAELNLKNGKWIRNFVVEYIYSKYQSGPIYHDHGTSRSDHISGKDDYYNHGAYGAWQHWGQVMGNPLYRSPIYNEDGKISVENNRFVAWHFGFDGQPLPNLDYRVLASWQDGLGTYDNPYMPRRRNFSMLMEATYRLPHSWAVKGAYGFDHGDIYGKNNGFQLSIIKNGIF